MGNIGLGILYGMPWVKELRGIIQLWLFELGLSMNLEVERREETRNRKDVRIVWILVFQFCFFLSFNLLLILYTSSAFISMQHIDLGSLQYPAIYPFLWIFFFFNEDFFLFFPMILHLWVLNFKATSSSNIYIFFCWQRSVSHVMKLSKIRIRFSNEGDRMFLWHWWEVGGFPPEVYLSSHHSILCQSKACVCFFYLTHIQKWGFLDLFL